MYINRKLITDDTMFKMEGGKFNELCNLMTRDKVTDDDIPVQLAMLVRTDSTNEIILEGYTLFVSKFVSSLNHNGYFALADTCKQLLSKYAPNLVKEVTNIKKTVLMPVGCFLDKNDFYFYFNLIIKPELKELFDIGFINIDDILLQRLDTKSIMVLPTVCKVN